MTGFWSVSVLIVTLAPLAYLSAAGVRVLARKGFNGSHVGIRTTCALGVALTACFFLSNPHRDLYTGLDAAKYRLMAKAFLAGRGLNDVDVSYAAVPDSVKADLLSRRALDEPARLTRDGVFDLIAWPGVETAPFFLPTLPLAAAGAARLGLSFDLFVPLAAVLWAVLVVVAATARGGYWGPLAAGALVFGTAWPAWFLRGFHAEAVGGLLVSAVITGSTLVHRDWRSRLLFGAMLGLSMAYHLTLVVLAVPVAVGLVLKSGRWRETLALVVGGGIGTIPLLLMHRHVCQPYGDFLNPAALLGMYRNVPAIRSVLVVGGAAVSVAGVMAVLGHVRPVRRMMGVWPFRQAASADCFLACVLAVGLPFIVGGALKKGALETWGGIGVFLFAGAVAAGFLFLRRHSVADRFLLAALAAAALVFIHIKGLEVPVGIWSQRRFTPVMLCLVALLAGPLASGLRAVASRHGLWVIVPAILTLFPAAWHITTAAPAYFVSNDAGAPAFARRVEMQIEAAGGDALTFFDYHLHSMPHQMHPTPRVFGLNEFVGRAHAHGLVMDWLADEALRGAVIRVVSSHPGSSTIVEDGMLLRPGKTLKARLAGTRGGDLTTAKRVEREIVNTFYTVEPVTEWNWREAVQQVRPEGSPLGLRRPWGRRAKGGVWSVAGSGIVGVIPPPGGRVRLELTAGWPAPEPGWTNQGVVVTPPFGGTPIELRVASGGLESVSGVITRNESDQEDRGWTGVYRLRTVRPYDPALYGMRGYGTDLGVLVDSVRIMPVKIRVCPLWIRDK